MAHGAAETFVKNGRFRRPFLAGLENLLRHNCLCAHSIRDAARFLLNRRAIFQSPGLSEPRPSFRAPTVREGVLPSPVRLPFADAALPACSASCVLRLLVHCEDETARVS